MASYGFEPTLSVLADGGGEGVRIAFVAGLLALKVSFGLMLLALALTLFRTEARDASRRRPQHSVHQRLVGTDVRATQATLNILVRRHVVRRTTLVQLSQVVGLLSNRVSSLSGTP